MAVAVRVSSRATTRETSTGRVDNTVRAERGGVFTADTTITSALGTFNARGFSTSHRVREVTDGQGNGIGLVGRLTTAQEANLARTLQSFAGRANTLKTNSNAEYRRVYDAAIAQGRTPRQATAAAQIARNQYESKVLASALRKVGVPVRLIRRAGTY